MTNEAMISVIEETQAFIDVLNANVDSIIMNEEVTDDKESITAEKDAEDGKWHVRGSIVNTCTKLDTEFFKLLQNSDQHSEEYRTVLKFLDISLIARGHTSVNLRVQGGGYKVKQLGIFDLFGPSIFRRLTFESPDGIFCEILDEKITPAC